MFPNPLTEIGARINRTMRSMVLAAAAGAAGMAALFFLSLGLFLWLQQTYGTINASLALGGGYAAIALVALIAVLVLQRSPRVEKRAAAAHAAQPQWWADPVMLTTGIEVLRIIGARRIIPLAVAALAAGYFFSGSMQKGSAPVRPRPKANGKGTFDEARN